MVAGLAVTTLTGVRDFPGNFKFNALGIIKDEVNIKNISNRKIMSVKEDILNCAFTLFLFLNPNTLIFSWLRSDYCTHPQIICYSHYPVYILPGHAFFCNNSHRGIRCICRLIYIISYLSCQFIV